MHLKCLCICCLPGVFFYVTKRFQFDLNLSAVEKKNIYTEYRRRKRRKKRKLKKAQCNKIHIKIDVNGKKNGYENLSIIIRLYKCVSMTISCAVSAEQEKKKLDKYCVYMPNGIAALLNILHVKAF